MSNSRKKYEWYRHHAWAGLGLLSVFLAIRYFIFISNLISLPILFALIFYILISLAYTYKYSTALSEETTEQSERMEAEIEKARLKLEKKRLKAEVKARKKGKS